MKPKELTGEDVLKLQTIFTNHDLQLSDAITKCMEIISDITNYTSVVLGTSSNENALKQVNIIPLTLDRIVAVVVTDKGIVENKQFNLPPKTNIKELVKTSEIINKMLVGTPIDEVSNRLEFEIKPIISRQINQYEAVYNIFYDAFNDFVKNTTNIHVSGKSKMLSQPEYDNIEDIRRLVNKFEDDAFIRKLVEDKENNRVNVYIGEENEFDKDVTIVKSKYNINGEEGTIAIIGPKRMEYDKVVGLLDYITKNLETRE